MLTVAAELVSHDPTMERDDVSMTKMAGPTEVRLPPIATVAPARVRVPDQLRFETNDALIPELTVREWRGCGTFTDPPAALITIKELPAESEPEELSIERTVTVLPFRVSPPPVATKALMAVSESPDPDVSRVVRPEPPWIVIEDATSPRRVMVKVTVEAPELKITELNSLPLRSVPANVMV